MIRTFCLFVLGWLAFAACQKEINRDLPPSAAVQAPVNGFINYTIKKGEQYCDKSSFKGIETSEMKFIVKFDSSAVYQTADPANQYDINKLFGFSDNNGPHHVFSARIGWRWSDNALRLFGYIYNESKVEYKELAPVAIGKEIACSIKVTATSYIFSVDGVMLSMQRLSTTPQAKGYQLYPYFGGDEVAPHDIRISIKQL